jgi:hypothetical protein
MNGRAHDWGHSQNEGPNWAGSSLLVTLDFLFLIMWQVGPIFNRLHLPFFSRQLAKLSPLPPSTTQKNTA